MKKSTSITRSCLTLIFGVVLGGFCFAQDPCKVSVPLEEGPAGMQVGQTTDQSAYYTFVADSGQMGILVVSGPENKKFNHIHTVKLFSGECDDLTEIASVDGDDQIEVSATQLVQGNTYYVQVITGVSGCSRCGYSTAKYDIGLSALTLCVPVGGCNLIENSGFSMINPWWWPINGNTNPFYSLSGNTECFWDIYNGTPETDPTNASPTYAHMWCQYTTSGNSQGSDGEGILQHVNIQTQHTYYLSYKAKFFHEPINPAASQVDNYHVMLTQSANSGLPNYAATNNQGYLFPSYPAINEVVDMRYNLSSTTWVQHHICFIATNNFDQLSIHPFMNNNPSSNNKEAWLDIDDVELYKVDDAGPDASINCSGSVTLGPACPIPGATYLWSPATGLSNPNIPNPIASPTVTTTYTMQVSIPGPDGCGTADVVTVYHTPYPAPQITDPGVTGCSTSATYCPQWMSAGSTYTWQVVDNGFSSIPFTQNSYCVNVNWAVSSGGAGGYVILTETIPNGCSWSDTVHVAVCCKNPDDGTYYYNEYATNIFPLSSYTGGDYYINGTLWVDENLYFYQTNFHMGPNAKIIVTGGHTLELDRVTMEASCCEMWDGIEGLSSTDVIIIHNKALVQDAIRGVISTNGAVYRLQDVKFNRNLCSITVNPYAGNHPGTVKACDFNSVNHGTCPTNGTLLPPYAGQWPMYAAYVNDVQSITFGDPTSQSANTISNLRNGFSFHKVTAYVYNNRFTSVNKNGLTSKAIEAYGSYWPLTSHDHITVGGTTTGQYEANTFTDCPFGVYTDIAMSSEISGNSFAYTTTTFFNLLQGTAISTNHNIGFVDMTVSIHNNTMTDYAVGIKCNENNLCNTDIRNNTIKRTLTGAANGIGISMFCTPGSNGQPSNAGTNLATQNTITGMRYGILANTMSGVRIINNWVNLRPTGSNSINALGIQALNCTGYSIASNTIDLENPNAANITLLNHGGIFVSNSPAGSVTCNIIRKLGYGIQMTGPATVSATVFRNSMKGHVRGIWISNSASIGQQGSSSVAPDNTWNTTTAHCYTDGITINSTTNGALSKMYYRSGVSYDPSPVVAGANGSPIPTQLVSGNPTQVLCAYVLPPDVHHGLLAQLAGSGSGLGQEGVYSQLLFDTTLTMGDTILVNFQDSMQASNLGVLNDAMKVYSLQAMYSAAEIQNAHQSVLSITPVNVIEEHGQAIADILLNRLATGNGFTDTDLSILRDIAALCPFTDGNAVYVARGILSNFEDTEYADACDADDARMFHPEALAETGEKGTSFQFYPNPSTGQVTLKYTLDQGEYGKVEILSVTGVMVSSVPLNGKTQEQALDLSMLDNGIYFVRISVNNEIKKTDRLVIIK